MSHIHCPRCSYEIEVPKQSTVATPAFECDRCGRKGDAHTWGEANKVARALAEASRLVAFEDRA